MAANKKCIGCSWIGWGILFVGLFFWSTIKCTHCKQPSCHPCTPPAVSSAIPKYDSNPSPEVRQAIENLQKNGQGNPGKIGYRGLALAPLLGTDRLVLRGIGERDTDDLADSLGDYETVYMLVYMPWPYDREHVQLYLENLNYSMGQGNAIYWAITLPTENRLMGVIGLTIEHEHSRATVHFWLGRKFWGKGYMTEAAKCVINYVFQGLNFNRLDVDLIAMNNRSQRVIEKCGFKFECEKEEYVKKEGKYENMKYYRLLRREYLTAQ